MLLYIRSGFRPDRFSEGVNDASTAYPYREVLSFCAVSTFELVVIYLVSSLRVLKTVWNRLSVAIALFFPWLFLNAELTAHATPVFGMHTTWLLTVNVGIGCIALKHGFGKT